MARLVGAGASCMRIRGGAAVCLIGAWDVSVYKSWSQAGALTGGVPSASPRHSAFVWVCVKERNPATLLTEKGFGTMQQPQLPSLPSPLSLFFYSIFQKGNLRITGLKTHTQNISLSKRNGVGVGRTGF